MILEYIAGKVLISAVLLLSDVKPRPTLRAREPYKIHLKIKEVNN